MKKFTLAVGCFCLLAVSNGQPIAATPQQTASYTARLAQSGKDTNRLKLLDTLTGIYILNNASLASAYAEEGYQLSKELNLKSGEIIMLSHKNFIANMQGDLVQGMDMAYQGMELSEKYAPDFLLEFYLRMAEIYFKQMDYENAKTWADSALHHPVFKKLPASSRWTVLMFAGHTRYFLNQQDSAYYYELKSVEEVSGNPASDLKYFSNGIIGKILVKMGRQAEAMHLLQSTLQKYDSMGYNFVIPAVQYTIAESFRAMGQTDSSNKYGLLAFAGGNAFHDKVVIRDAAVLLAANYENLDIRKAYDYLALSIEMRDSIADIDKLKQFQAIKYKDEKSKNDLARQAEVLKTRFKLVALVAGLFILAAIIFILWKNNRSKHKANKTITEAFKQLKATQAQLIQSEKMASLGELTAGIAHEIQNPLNFVNNFSEINTELIEELKGERHKAEGVRSTPLEDELIDDIEQNMEKIAIHGKRADAIVKGMLQHSRSSTGKKEPTNINKLADEYLHLAYHGLRAKDKSFNAALKTDYDENIGLVNIIPQDIGRVILNLITNAFYAVGEKKKLLAVNYEPLVTVSTKKTGDKLEIRVTDNGNGIPQNIIDKIFQPFFTTKPTGQGTGLGLSLAYDIVKAHGGELKVETNEGQGSSFIIQLPLA